MKRELIVVTLALSMFCTASYAGNIASASLDLSKMEVNFLQGSGSFSLSDGYSYTGSRIVTYDYSGGNVVFQVQNSSWTESSASWYGNTTSASNNNNILNTFSTANSIGTTTGSAQPNSYAIYNGFVIINPSSTLRFSAPYQLSGISTANHVNRGDELASAQVYLTAWQDLSEPYKNPYVGVAPYSYPKNSQPDFSMSGVLELTLANNTTTEQRYYFSAASQAFAVTSVTAVPEPKTAMLMLLGLVLLAGSVQRRTRQK